jgi:hypothetical protein
MRSQEQRSETVHVIGATSLFEAISVGAALALAKRRTIRATGVSKWIDSDELRILTTGATNSQTMVSGRILYAAQRFGGE